MPTTTTTTMTRRQFTRATAAAIAGTALAGPAATRLLAQSPIPISWRRINRDARVVEGMGGNALVFKSGKEALLIDTKVINVGELTRGFVERADFAVTRVINTHHHADHSGGNAAWTGDTPLLAHTTAKERILGQHKLYQSSLQRDDPQATTPPIADFAPTETTDGDTEITVGETTVNLRHFGPGHTDNDLAVHIPEQNILHTGDLVFRDMHIYVDNNGGVSTKGWLASVEELIKLCDRDTIVIPGHGPVTDIRGLEEQRDYIRDLREIVAGAIKDGKTREETYRLPFPGTEKFDSPRGLAYALNGVYTEMTGESAG